MVVPLYIFQFDVHILHIEQPWVGALLMQAYNFPAVNEFWSIALIKSVIREMAACVIRIRTLKGF